jgi:hypothetical protein
MSNKKDNPCLFFNKGNKRISLVPLCLIFETEKSIIFPGGTCFVFTTRRLRETCCCINFLDTPVPNSWKRKNNLQRLSLQEELFFFFFTFTARCFIVYCTPLCPISKQKIIKSGFCLQEEYLYVFSIFPTTRRLVKAVWYGRILAVVYVDSPVSADESWDCRKKVIGEFDQYVWFKAVGKAICLKFSKILIDMFFGKFVWTYVHHLETALY